FYSCRGRDEYGIFASRTALSFNAVACKQTMSRENLNRPQLHQGHDRREKKKQYDWLDHPPKGPAHDIYVSYIIYRSINPPCFPSYPLVLLILSLSTPSSGFRRRRAFTWTPAFIVLLLLWW